MAAPTNLFVNVNASNLADALVRSVVDMTPVSFPELVVGDSRFFNLYFVDGQGDYADFSGNGAYIPSIAIGSCGFPTGGTFTITFGGQTTAALAYNASMATIQAAFQALSSVGAGNATITGVPGQYFTITFTGSLGNAPQSQVTTNFSLLTPASTIDVNTIIAGSASPAANCVQLLSFQLNPITFNGSMSVITNGWTGELSANTLEILEALSQSSPINETFQVSVADPSGNTSTYVQASATIVCTTINANSFAGAQKPLLATQAALDAAVLGLNNFTFQSASLASAGNVNISPTATSRHHRVNISLTGSTASETYTICAQTNNSPNTGDTIIGLLNPGAVSSRTIKFYNSSTGGTLLATINLAEASNTPILFILTYTGSAWEMTYNTSILLGTLQNLAGINSPLAAKANLKTLFSKQVSQTASFTSVATDDGTLFLCSATAAPIVVTLPSASSAGQNACLAFLKTDGSTNAISTGVTGGNISQQGALLILISTGTAWDILLNTQSVQGVPANSSAKVFLAAVVSLTGGTPTSPTSLDSVPTASGAMAVGDVVEFCVDLSNQTICDFLLVTKGAGSNSIPWLVYPQDYNASTNPVAWQLIRVSRQGGACVWNPTQVKFQQLTCSGAAGSESLGVGPGFAIT